jgi:hypothetical protein
VFSSTTINAPELVPGARLGSYGFITSSTAGTLTVDSLILSNTTNLLWNLGTPGVIGGNTNDLVVDNGDLTLAGTLIDPAVAGVGTYTLITYGGTLTNEGLTVDPFNPAFSYAVDLSTPGEVNLVVTAAPEPATFAIGIPAALMLLRRRRQMAGAC